VTLAIFIRPPQAGHTYAWLDSSSGTSMASYAVRPQAPEVAPIRAGSGGRGWIGAVLLGKSEKPTTTARINTHAKAALTINGVRLLTEHGLICVRSAPGSRFALWDHQLANAMRRHPSGTTVELCDLLEVTIANTGDGCARPGGQSESRRI
jgi:hypothetical protein